MSRILKVKLPLSGRAEQSDPMGLVLNRHNPATAANELIARKMFDLEAFRWR